MSKQLKDRQRYRDNRAKEKRKARKVINEWIKVAIAALIVILIAGCPPLLDEPYNLGYSDGISFVVNWGHEGFPSDACVESFAETFNFPAERWYELDVDALNEYQRGALEGFRFMARNW